VSADEQDGWSGAPVVKLVQDALDLLLKICSNKNGLDDQSLTLQCENDELWILFLNSVCVLPSVDLTTFNLTENEKSCIFLNLYHILLLHSFLVIGAPSTLFQWSSFFSTYAYEAFGDIFSLAELEHCVIKAGIGKPNSVILQALVPESKYDFALASKDFRLLWAVNCGSKSCVESVPVYLPSSLEEQLDANMRASVTLQMKASFTTDLLRKTIKISLPQTCQWYRSVIIAGYSPQNATKMLLHVMNQFSSGETHEIVSGVLLGRDVTFSIKYESLEYKCRVLTRCSAT